MSTAYVYNALKSVSPDGTYETRENPLTGETEFGVTLKYAGMDWWFPYQKVTPIPNYTLCEPDHEKNTPTKGVIVDETAYRNWPVSGDFIATFLTNGESMLADRTVTNAQRGIQIIEGKPTGNSLRIFAGLNADLVGPHSGTRAFIFTDVPEKVATPSEIAKAEKACEEYKMQVIKDYFASKRNRMTGGQGKNSPDNVTRVYMDELNIQDIDDPLAHVRASGGLTPEAIQALVAAIYKGQEIKGADLERAVETVNKRQKATLVRKKPRPLNLAANKAAYDAEHPEEVNT